MKRFSSVTLVLISTLIISACGARGAQTAPTLNAIDIQSTAAAVAFTMLAETQSAIPTATPIPPTSTFTNTPLPTDTPLPLPSSQATSSAPTGNTGGGDPCINKVMPDTLRGETVRIRLNNTTNADLTVSVYLVQTATQNECGYRIYSVTAQEPLVINNLIEGCYTFWAWNPDPASYFIVTNGTNCVDNSGPWVFEITTSIIKLRT